MRPAVLTALAQDGAPDAGAAEPEGCSRVTAQISCSWQQLAVKEEKGGREKLPFTHPFIPVKYTSHINPPAPSPQDD